MPSTIDTWRVLHATKDKRNLLQTQVEPETSQSYNIRDVSGYTCFRIYGMSRVILVSDLYSDRHVLGLLLCAGVIALSCASLCCARGSHTQRHTRTYYYCCCCILTKIGKRPNTFCTGVCCMLEDMLALANSVCFCPVVCSQEKAQQSTARHGTAWHSTARRCVTPLT